MPSKTYLILRSRPGTSPDGVSKDARAPMQLGLAITLCLRPRKLDLSPEPRKVRGMTIRTPLSPARCLPCRA